MIPPLRLTCQPSASRRGAERARTGCHRSPQRNRFAQRASAYAVVCASPVRKRSFLQWRCAAGIVPYHTGAMS
jgi:hypothetical protein